MKYSRRTAMRTILGSALYTVSTPAISAIKPVGPKATEVQDPTNCSYAPPGEYMKDHTFIFHDGWYHLFAISGTQGYYHGYNGNEETFSWSISKDLINWEFRGHIMHPSLRKGTFDQHEVWAPFCLKANNKFYMFYTGIIQSYRAMEYRKLGHKHRYTWKEHKQTQGLAISTDLTDWEKVGDPVKGLDIPGRDSNIIWDNIKKRWLLYSTGQGIKVGGEKFHTVLVSQSKDLTNWSHIGVCAHFSSLDKTRDYGFTVESWEGFKNGAGTTESMVTMKHPITGKWIMLGNWQYAISDDPVDFRNSEVRYYDNTLDGKVIDLGFACEIVNHNEKWYRSGTFGKNDYWKLGFTEIKWEKEGAFSIVQPSKVTN